ncbi:MAG: S-layer homology domain-containing protein, partial [Candidatus Eremiobacteraeota bacterium]|nr:S-layer homology domain-containing protein [Candidatus Eremiobacteraeota bacterium]
MKRLATLVVAASFAFAAFAMTGRIATATPFSDVPANHWAYQAIQSLAADGLVEGYPNGRFKGDRPMTRYEMAVLIARVIAKVQSMTPSYASKADLDKLQKLMDAFKDELDALGVRVTNLEDSLDALDKRTKFAQSIEFHGFMQPDVTLRQRYTLPQTVSGGNGGAGIFNAFVSTDYTNTIYTQQGTQDQIRYDDRFTFVYHITDNLTVSVPIRIMTYDTGASEFTGTLGSSGSPFSGNGTQVGLDPGVDITIGKTGNISNLWIKYGVQDNIKSSRTGLSYKAPDIADQYSFEEGPQNFEHGLSLTGTLNGLTDFQFYLNREDALMLNTQTTYPEGYNLSGPGGTYLFLTTPNQVGYSQNGYPGPGGTATQTLTFNAGTGTLTTVYLTAKALIGTVYVSAYNGTLYNSSGQIIGGGVNAAPAFVYDDALNAVTFTTPLPAGSTVSVTFVG